MSVIAQIEAYAAELAALRHDLHAHPELGFEETRTAAIVAEKLRAWGIETHTGIGGTGVVGLVRGRGRSARRIALRADMDALPMEERTGLAYASRTPGQFHGCGHDAHTTILLGTARYLAETQNFDGTAVLVFQPAEEGRGGARAMLADRILERFPFEEIYALHNEPELEAAQVGIWPGPVAAACDFFDIKIEGTGGHGAYPHFAKDPIVVAAALVQSLQSIISRNIDPAQSGVLSVTQVHAGSAYNVIPGEAHLAGTIRAFSEAGRGLVRDRLRNIAAGLAAAYEVKIGVEINDVFSVLVNHAAETDHLAAAAREIVGAERVLTHPNPTFGSEDFADFLNAVPGAYFLLGHGGNVPIHNPNFVIDDNILPVGASIFARLIERRMPLA